MAKVTKKQEAPAVEAKSKCPECGREFKSALAVAIHRGQVHKAKAEKPKAEKPVAAEPDRSNPMVEISLRIALTRLPDAVLLLGKLGADEARIIF